MVLSRESITAVRNAGESRAPPEQAGRKVSQGNIKDTHQGLPVKLGAHSPPLSLCSLNGWVCSPTPFFQLLMEK